MKKLLPYVLAFHAALAAAILLWALQEKFPGPLTNTLSPVWNSPWEMGKAAFFPLLAAAPTLWVLQKGGSRGGLCLMALSGAALAWRYNALLSGGDAAGSMGVNVALLRWVSLLLASLITAVCVSFLGMIGFVGIICPHAVKRLVGHDHRWALPAATLCGGALLLAADAVSRSIGSGSALPVGAITSLLGAPFFLTLIFGKKEGGVC